MLALIPGVSRSGATIVGGMVMRLDRPAAAEFSFFLAIPTMTRGVRARVPRGAPSAVGGPRRWRSRVGLVMAFVSSLLVIRPFLGVRAAFGLCAVCVVSDRARRRAAGGDGGRVDARHDSVAAPPVRHRIFRPGAAGRQPGGPHLGFRRGRRVHGAALHALFQDSISAPTCRPGLGILTTALLILMVGAFATNVLGKRLLQRLEGYLLQDSGVSHGLCAGEAAGARVFAGQRIRLQTGRDDSNGVPRLYTWISNQGVFHPTRPAGPNRSSLSMCRPIICISVMWSSAGATTRFFPI